MSNLKTLGSGSTSKLFRLHWLPSRILIWFLFSPCLIDFTEFVWFCAQPLLLFLIFLLHLLVRFLDKCITSSFNSSYYERQWRIPLPTDRENLAFSLRTGTLCCVPTKPERRALLNDLLSGTNNGRLCSLPLKLSNYYFPRL